MILHKVVLEHLPVQGALRFTPPPQNPVKIVSVFWHSTSVKVFKEYL